MKNLPLIAKALSDPTRIKLIELLRQNNYCVNALAKFLEITQPAVSQHLRILKQADLVIPQKKGYWVHYALNFDTANKYLEELNNLFSINKKETERLCATKRRQK